MNLFLATHGAAHPAAEHGHEAVERAAGPIDPQLLPYITAIIVFGIAFFVLYKTVWPKITRGLDDRSRKIREEIEAAEAAREQANAALADYQRNLAQAREEANQMIAKAKADAKAVAEDMKARNQAELMEMKQRATREIESAKQAAISAIYTEAANLGTSMAAKILQREIAESDQGYFLDESLRELAKTAGD